MARTTAPLTDNACRTAKAREREYKLFDGDGLYLLVKPNGRKGWRLRYVKPDGREGLICGHGFRAMACSALVESGLWSETAIERQMSHKERNNVRAAYTHKAEFLEERRMIMTWWSRFLEANREDHVTPHEFAKQTGENVTRLRSAKRTE
ncbi:integrase arm-type DNA-binding domain-containing protein [Pseudomonas viridiflava]|uniref:integrase arm-type DNA-binding domain-containing protein n=1 Tax=Pseudomonas viridiflava TaxID=33069 RepID=UPI000F02D58F